MSIKRMRWPVLGGIAVLGLLGATLLLPPVPRSKVRVLRVSAVNSVAPPFLTFPSPSR